MVAGEYAIASGLVGFSDAAGSVDTLRVRILEVLSPFDVLVITASLTDAGTKLVLDPKQLEMLSADGKESAGFQHRTGLVSMG